VKILPVHVSANQVSTCLADTADETILFLACKMLENVLFQRWFFDKFSGA